MLTEYFFQPVDLSLKHMRFTERAAGGVVAKNFRRRYAMADNFYRKQIFVVFAKKFLQTRYLTGSARKQHKTPRFQEIGGKPERIADAALHILASRKRRQLRFGFGMGMADIQIFVERRPENDATPRDCAFCKQRKNSARRACHALGQKLRLRRKNGARQNGVGLVYHWANALAQAAIHAEFEIYLGVQKALAVGGKIDATPRADLPQASHPQQSDFVLGFIIEG